MTTVRKAATDLRVGDYFWINRELRRVTDVDALYVDREWKLFKQRYGHLREFAELVKAGLAA